MSIWRSLIGHTSAECAAAFAGNDFTGPSGGERYEEAVVTFGRIRAPHMCRLCALFQKRSCEVSWPGIAGQGIRRV